MPKVIDLFAGVGGLSLGARRAGFDLAGVVELDENAMFSHCKNFPTTPHLAQDVATLSGRDLLEAFNLSEGELDGLVGGPPCQGFSTMGKQVVDDQRNDLFWHFFRLVKETSPSFFVAENVPGILESKYDATRQRAFSQLTDNYIFLEPIIVKANEYGAPTTRKRVFFIGYNPKKLNKDLNQNMFLPPSATETNFVKHAIVGLPEIISPSWQSYESGWQKIQKPQPRSDSFFTDRMVNHVPCHMGDPASLERYFSKDEVSGCMGTRHSPEVELRFSKLNFGQVDNVSKSTRLNPDGFCPTLRAGTGKERGSHQAVRPIHPSQHRVITVREAARLQGFPDWFVFHPTKWQSFRQIGNSVSPIVGEIILKQIWNHLLT